MIAGQQQALFVGVARVVQQHLQPVPPPASHLHSPPQIGQPFLKGRQVGIAQQQHISRVQSPHLLQHLDELFRVRDRVAQQFAIYPAIVGPRSQDQSTHLGLHRLG